MIKFVGKLYSTVITAAIFHCFDGTLVKTSCLTGWFYRFDHSSNDRFENCSLKIAVPKFSKHIIKETTTILGEKKACKGIPVSKRLTIYLGHLWEMHAETATR